MNKENFKFNGYFHEPRTRISKFIIDSVEEDRTVC